MLNETNDRLRRKQVSEELLSSTLDDFNEEILSEDHNVEELVMSVDQSFQEYKEKFEKSKILTYPKIKPIGQTVITSAGLMNIMEQKSQINRGDINLQLLEGLKRSVSDVQTVVAVGPHCKEVKIGDLVKLRFSDFQRVTNPNTVNAKETFELPVETIDDNNYLEVHERNIKFIYLKEDM